jgi:hypothetical protein
LIGKGDSGLTDVSSKVKQYMSEGLVAKHLAATPVTPTGKLGALAAPRRSRR